MSDSSLYIAELAGAPHKFLTGSLTSTVATEEFIIQLFETPFGFTLLIYHAEFIVQFYQFFT